MGFQLGETYSGYKFLDIVKQSKSGVEYRVKNTWAGRLETLRALPQTAQEDPEQVERFMREMRLRACLIHPNIVTLLNALEIESQLVMTTEMVEGPTLAERLAAGPFPWREAAGLIRQALAAVAAAHKQKIVHRDISPENIVITPEGVLKLANFALAKISSGPKLTQVGMAMGNLKYISPEQIKGIADIDVRSDLYSLGVVLYEMLTGRAPFNAASQFELMAAQVNELPPPPDELNPAVPQEVSAVVMKAIAKEPADRYQTAEAFDRALADVGGEAAQIPQASPEPPAVAGPTVPVPGTPAPAPRPVEPVVAPAAVAERPVPIFVVRAAGPSIWRQLAIGGAAGAGLGVLIMTLWLLVK